MPRSMPTDSPVTLDMVASNLPVFVSVSFRTRARRLVRIDVCVCWRFGAPAASRRVSYATVGRFTRHVDVARARFDNAPIMATEWTRAAKRMQRKIGRAAMSNAPEMQMRSLSRCINLIATQ